MLIFTTFLKLTYFNSFSVCAELLPLLVSWMLVVNWKGLNFSCLLPFSSNNCNNNNNCDFVRLFYMLLLLVRPLLSIRFCVQNNLLGIFSLAANLSSNADGWPVKKDNIKTKRDLRSVSWRRHGRTQQMSFKTKYHLTFSTSDHDVIDGRSQSSYCDHIGTTDLWQYQVIYNNNRRL